MLNIFTVDYCQVCSKKWGLQLQIGPRGVLAPSPSPAQYIHVSVFPHPRGNNYFMFFSPTAFSFLITIYSKNNWNCCEKNTPSPSFFYWDGGTFGCDGLCMFYGRSEDSPRYKLLYFIFSLDQLDVTG